MPWISFFADEQDADILLRWLNSESEIAFIVPDKPQDLHRQKWKAVSTIDNFSNGKYSLWHMPAGSLPLLTETGFDQIIAEPYKGWTEQITGADRVTSSFGAGHPAEIRLELWLRHRPYSDERSTLPELVSWRMGNTDLLAASDFQWIGNRYQLAPQETWRFWRRLKACIARKTIRLTPSGQRWSFWAFPSAFRKLKNGMTYYAQGWDLTEAIRTADDLVS